MKKLQLCFLLLMGSVQIGRTQEVPSSKQASIDFLKYAYNPKANDRGLLTVEVDYVGGRDGNKAGKAIVYMIHKNGGNWWIEQAKKKYPNLDSPPDRRCFYAISDAKKYLFGKEASLKDYNKWAFFTDKKYLHKIVDGTGDVDGLPSYGWYLKPNIRYEKVIYEQKAGSSVWIEIERKQFESGPEGEFKDTIDPKTGKVITYDFSIEQKLKESNEATPNTK